MPELPEVEVVRRTLRPIIDRPIAAVSVRRRDMIDGVATPAALLVGDRVASIERLGKNLALVGTSGRVVAVHLGMTGSLTLMGTPAVPAGSSRTPVGDQRGTHDNHTHVLWRFADRSRLAFRDPRRFGGLATFADTAALRDDWRDLGPDALTITGSQLHERTHSSARAIKAALLDQRVLAGVGNIYADEALFLARIDPRTRCNRLARPVFNTLAEAITRVLRDAINAGGSTIRDYVNAAGGKGGFASAHLVYGRAGDTCTRCGTILKSCAVAQRTTVFCPACQPARR